MHYQMSYLFKKFSFHEIAKLTNGKLLLYRRKPGWYAKNTLQIVFVHNASDPNKLSKMSDMNNKTNKQSNPKIWISEQSRLSKLILKRKAPKSPKSQTQKVGFLGPKAGFKT